MDKRLFGLLIGALFAFIVDAQDIEVKKFEPLEKDQTAALSPRKDINGVTCGLVKVALKEPGAEFEGSVMGDVQFTGNEYLVYMPNGSKRLGIKHPDYLPTTIVFADYGTKKVASATTYELKVKTNKKKAKVDNSKKGMAVFNIKPSNAMLLIDGQVADGSGGAYTLSLPYGTHYYTVKLKDFCINNQIVQIDKNAKNINVDLTEFFAKVSVNCQDDDAYIYINEELQGSGKWEGTMLPGKCVINIMKKGYYTQSKTLELKDCDSIACHFSTMKMIAGGLYVDYKPKGCDVFLDGAKIGVSPISVNQIPVGLHILELKKQWYEPTSLSINIAEDVLFQSTGSLRKTNYGHIIECAEGKGEFDDEDIKNACIALGNYHRTGKGDCLIDTEYYTISENDSCREERCIDKAIEWYNKNENSCLKELCICYILKKDYTRSMGYVRKMIADSHFYGFQDITYYLYGWHYYFGRGVNKNEQEAWKWFDKMSKGGRYEGMSTREFLKEYYIIQALGIETIE